MMRADLDSLASRLAACVDDRLPQGIFRVHRAAFVDPHIFELEQRYIFERTWCFLGHESQLHQPHDFITTQIGSTPILVSRDGEGRLGAFVNACRHKGALLCSREQGRARAHVCPYHGWVFDSAGKNTLLKYGASAGYSEAFLKDDHHLIPIARLGNYRGFLFGSLNRDVPELAAFLGSAATLIDLIVDQSPHGVELVPGRTLYTYEGNWKLQLDNGVDPYHLSEAHASFLDVQARRRKGMGNVDSRSFDWSRRDGLPAGAINFDHGHSAVWLEQPEPDKRPIYPAIDEIRSRVGNTRADWMLKGRNVGIFPNMQIADAISPMLRIFRPLAVNLTEMRAYCIAPVGEPTAQRAWRLRQYEDFFNPGGMATPDDAVLYEDCQRGLSAMPLDYLQGTSRGMGFQQSHADEVVSTLGIQPVSSALGRYDTYSEVAFQGPYREWQRLLLAGVKGERPYE